MREFTYQVPAFGYLLCGRCLEHLNQLRCIVVALGFPAADLGTDWPAPAGPVLQTVGLRPTHCPPAMDSAAIQAAYVQSGFAYIDVSCVLPPSACLPTHGSNACIEMLKL